MDLQFLTLTLLFSSYFYPGTVGVERLIIPLQRTTGLGCIHEGEIVNYTCTVDDSAGTGRTEWQGDVINCPNQNPNNVIRLFHVDYNSGTTQPCSNGTVVAKSVALSGTEYTSVLTMSISRLWDEQLLVCSLSGARTVGSDTLQVGVTPDPPESPVCSFPVPGETFTVSWRPPSGGVLGGAEYSVSASGDCGTCTISAGLMISCSGWIASGQTCRFTANTVTMDCGFESKQSEMELVTLNVPPQPSRVSVVPTYSSSGILTNMKVNIQESEVNNTGSVCEGVSRDAINYFLEYMSSSGMICSSRRIPAGCASGVCTDVFNVTSDCPGESYTVSVRAVNVVGDGPAKNVTVNLMTACTLLDQPTNGKVTFSDDFISPGVIATYQCNPGYELNGNNTRICQSDVQWSGDPPACRCVIEKQPLESVNKGTLLSADCFSANYSVQSGYCPSTFTATFDSFSSEWRYPTTSVCVGTVVGITFVLTLVFSLALGIVIGAVIDRLCISKCRSSSGLSTGKDVGLRYLKRRTSEEIQYDYPQVVSKMREDTIKTEGNVAYVPVTERH